MIHRLMVMALWLLPTCGGIQGVGSVIDGDTIEIRGKRIRLHGVDAPESSQNCTQDGKLWRCGQQAALALSDMIGQRIVRCEQKDTDRYGRLVCECFVEEKNINSWLVENGWAVAYRKYSMDYVAEEGKAKATGAGIWSSTFDNPSDYRKGKRTASVTYSQDKQSSRCEIKGNVSSDGEKIYHLPSDKYYDQTRISVSKGERWFCSEDEAQEAGWRRARN